MDGERSKYGNVCYDATGRSGAAYSEKCCLGGLMGSMQDRWTGLTAFTPCGVCVAKPLGHRLLHNLSPYQAQ
jgi:hypothetical protein